MFELSAMHIVKLRNGKKSILPIGSSHLWHVLGAVICLLFSSVASMLREDDGVQKRASPCICVCLVTVCCFMPRTRGNWFCFCVQFLVNG